MDTWPSLIGAISLGVTLFCPRRHALAMSVFCVMALAALIPSHSPSNQTLFLSLCLQTALLLIGLARGARGSSLPAMPTSIVAFIVISSIANMRGSTDRFAGVVGLQGIVLLLLVPAVAVLGRPALARLLPIALSLIVAVQLVFAVSESFFSEPAVWPLTTGKDVLAHRVNFLVPALAGRAIGSTAHPIPLGVLAGTAAVLSIYMLMWRKRRLYAVALIVSVACMALAGTRSAVILGLLVLCLTAAAHLTQRRILPYLLAASIAGVLAIRLGATRLLGLEGLTGTASYQNRAGLFERIDFLFSRSLGEVLLGSGSSAITGFFRTGAIGTEDRVVVFDNEYLRTFAAAGLLGLALLLVVIARGLYRGNAETRLVLGYLSLVLVVFDALSWHLFLVMFVIAASPPPNAPVAVDEAVASDNISPLEPSARNNRRLRAAYARPASSFLPLVRLPN